MSRVFIVAWRDFKLTVMRKAFLIGIVGVPLLIVVIMAVAILLIVQHKEPPLEGTVAIVDPSGAVLDAAAREFDREQIDKDLQEQLTEARDPTALKRGEVRIELEQHDTNDQGTIEALKRRTRAGDLLAAAVIPPASLEMPDPDADPVRIELYVAEGMDADHVGLIERRLGQAVVRVRAGRQGLDAEEALAMTRRPRSETRRLLEGGGEATETEDIRELRQLIPMAFFMLLWVATLTAGQHLMMSTIEEKSNRVMEVLLSAVSPLQLMTGKIIGQGGVGLLIMSIYSSLAIAALVMFAFAHLIEPLDLLYLCIYFFMAYFMIASLMAAVGSAVSDIREANTLITPIMMLLMLLWGLWLPISADPNGLAGTIFSFVPPAIPFAMILRIAADEPVPFWQIPATIAWGYLCMAVMVWMAAKIFRVGVLMYGKPPSPMQLLKWIRYA